MKRMLPLLMALMMLGGCAATRAPAADAYAWQLITAQRQSDGAIIARGADMAGMPATAEAVRVVCEISGSTFTLTGPDGTIHRGSCQQSHVTPDARQLRVALGSAQGLATLAYTAYADGREVPTLLLTLDGYALTFQPPSGEKIP